MYRSPMITPPKKVEYSSLERIMEMVSIAAIIFSVVYIIMKYPLLPDMIASHFDINGNPDSYSGKSTILILGGINIFMYALMTVFRFFPKTWNTFPMNPTKKTTERGIEKVYKITGELLTVVKAAVISMFAVIEVIIINIAINQEGNIIMPVLAIVFVLIAIVIFYTVKVFKAYKE